MGTNLLGSLSAGATQQPSAEVALDADDDTMQYVVLQCLDLSGTDALALSKRVWPGDRRDRSLTKQKKSTRKVQISAKSVHPQIVVLSMK